MHFYPASLLISVAVLLPNLLFIALPPTKGESTGKPAEPRSFAICERVGQAGCLVLPLFFPLGFSRGYVFAAWVVMALSLAFYYAGWLRFFIRGRDYALLFTPMSGIPIPMAISPVLYLLASSVPLGSIWQAVAATVLAVGHIPITAREFRRLSSSRE